MPQAREGALLINVPYTNQCYLYGGVAAEPLNGIAKLAVNGTTDCKWDIVFPNYIGNAEKIIGRYGFKGIYYNGKIFFVCGCQVFDKMRKERLCLNEIVIYDPYNNEMTLKNPHHFPERLLVPRKYFAGFLLDNCYYCHGGIENSG